MLAPHNLDQIPARVDIPYQLLRENILVKYQIHFLYTSDVFFFFMLKCTQLIFLVSFNCPFLAIPNLIRFICIKTLVTPLFVTPSNLVTSASFINMLFTPSSRSLKKCNFLCIKFCGRIDLICCCNFKACFLKTQCS